MSTNRVRSIHVASLRETASDNQEQWYRSFVQIGNDLIVRCGASRLSLLLTHTSTLSHTRTHTHTLTMVKSGVVFFIIVLSQVLLFSSQAHACVQCFTVGPYWRMWSSFAHRFMCPDAINCVLNRTTELSCEKCPSFDGVGRLVGQTMPECMGKCIPLEIALNPMPEMPKKR